MSRKLATKKPQDPGLEKTVQKEPIAIIGIGCRFPGGANDPESFWQLLTNEVDAITDIPADRVDVAPYYDPILAAPGKIASSQGGFLNEVDKFDSSFFGISPREANYMDPQQRLLLETAWEALEDAGQVPESLKMSQTGVFIGMWTTDYTEKMYKAIDDINLYVTTGGGRYAASGRLSYFFGFQGPSLTIDTACSSSLVTVHLACQSLREGESTLALAGGVNVILEPSISIGYSRSKMLSPDGRCKFGDAKANGYVRSEGVGIVVLKRLSQAIADHDRIYAVIRGSAVNNDGRSSELLVAPGIQSQIKLLHEAYRNAGIDPSQVGYVEAHGTGTPVGDPVELEALGTVLSENRDKSRACRVGSVKTNIGHTEAASGVAGLIKAALCLKYRAIPASLHFKEPNSKIPWAKLSLQMQTKLTPWPDSMEPAIAAVNSFGITGTNAHIVLAEYPQASVEKPVEVATSEYLLPLSAQTPEALKALAGSYMTLLRKQNTVTLPDLSYTASCRRTHHAERLAVTGKSRQEIADQLSNYLQAGSQASAPANRNKIDEQAKVVFVFPGQGAQWLGMGRELLKQNRVFQESLKQCDEAIRLWADWSLLEQLMLDEDSSKYRLNEISVIQPVLFAIEVSLAAVWRSWGVEPSAVIGHSMGEAAAAYVSGALSLEDAAHVICKRSQLMQRTSGMGAMVLIGLPFAESEELIKGLEDKLSIAVHNSPRSTVISGDPGALEEVMDKLRARDIFCRHIKVDVASHSPQMDPLQLELVQSLESIHPMTSSIPFYSTVTQDIRDGLTLDAQYWGKNLRQPVNFMTTIQRLLESEHTVFIELSPHPILLSAIEEICHHLSKPGYGIASLRRDQPEVKTMLAELGLLYKFGYSVDWNKLHPEGGKLIALPGYAWQRERYWFDTSQADTNQSYLAGKIEHPLLGYRLPSLAHLSGHHIWQNKFPSLRRYLSARSSNLAEPIFREMALAAANIALGSKNHVISRFNISEPALKSENGETILQSTLVQNGSSATFELFSRKDEMSAWRRHLTAEIRIGDVDNSWFYNLVWEASSLSSSKLDESLMDGGYWLILSDCLGVGEELAARLKDHGANCRVISSSDTLIDFDRMLDGLEEEASIRIVYLWGLDLQPNHQLTSLGMAADQNSSVEALISLMQAIIRQRWSHMPSLFAVTQGSQVTSTEQPELMPSLMWGLGRVLALEHPDLWHKIIDLPTGEPVQSLADTLLVEIFQHDGEDQIVYRGEQRYVPRLVPADHSESAAHPFTVTSDGAYLITGGLGMLGIQLSHWLVDHGAKHLVLTSRNGLPDRSEWSSIAPGTLVSQRISAVQGLEETGVQVSVVQADVSDDSAMKQLFVQFGKSLPPLRGVIHAAGTNANQVFTELDLNTWREVLLPKVAGAWILHNLTSELPLDFFVCFSSAASVWGSRGMAPYASANHFLDQLAYYRRVHKLPALTVNWGWWSGDGIATTQQSDLFAKVGLSTMPAGKALAALAHLIESDATQRVVADVDWNVFAPIYESQRERPFLNHIRPQKIDDPARPTTKMERNVFLEQLQAAAPEKHRDMLTDYIRQTTAEILGFDKSRLLNTREGFFKMGMDSLMTVQLRTRLESSLGCSLPPTIAFEYPTISQLAVYMLQDVLHLPAKTTNSEVTAQPDASVTDPELDALSDDNLLDLLDDELAKVENLTK